MSNYSDQIRNSGLIETLHDNWVDDRERKYEKRKELLSKFTDGGRRYNHEQLFRNVIDGLVHGTEPLKMIEILIDINKEQSDRIKEYLNLHAYPNKTEIKPEHYEQSKPSK